MQALLCCNIFHCQQRAYVDVYQPSSLLITSISAVIGICRISVLVVVLRKDFVLQCNLQFAVRTIGRSVLSINSIFPVRLGSSWIASILLNCWDLCVVPFSKHSHVCAKSSTPYTGRPCSTSVPILCQILGLSKLRSCTICSKSVRLGRVPFCRHIFTPS